MYVTHILSFTDKWQLWVHGRLTLSFPTTCNSDLTHSSIVQQVHIQCLDESYHSPPSSITSESVALQQSLRKLDDSFKKLFWQPQMKALACRDLQQRRWHPLITKWCLHLHMPSSAAYTATWGHQVC